MGKQLQLRLTIGSAIAAPAVLHGSSANAAILQTDRANFDSLYPASVLADWDNFSDGDVLVNGSKVNGITYQSSLGDVTITSKYQSTSSPNSIGRSPHGFFLSTDAIRFSFDQALTAFGIDINTFATGGAVQATTDTGEVITSLLNPFPNSQNGEFLGFSSELPFFAITLAGTGKNSFTLDTLRGMPAAIAPLLPAEPVPTPALLPGLVGMGIALLRKRRAGGLKPSPVHPPNLSPPHSIDGLIQATTPTDKTNCTAPYGTSLI